MQHILTLIAALLLAPLAALHAADVLAKKPDILAILTAESGAALMQRIIPAPSPQGKKDLRGSLAKPVLAWVRPMFHYERNAPWHSND